MGNRSSTSSKREAVAKTLQHSNKGNLPRGELFFSRTFLDVYFPGSRGDYVGQIASAADLLGLSVVGVNLHEEWSRALLREGCYGRLKEYFTVGYVNGPVLLAIEQQGFRKAMVDIKRDRRALNDVFSRLIRDIEEVCGLAAENGISAILLADDIAGNRGLLFSHDDFAESVLPLYSMIADTIKRNNLYAFFHSDGETRAIIGPLIEAGYDCIHPVDSQAGLDLYELESSFKNRVSFMGHIDIITWSDERISSEVACAEERFKAGGVIIGSACGLSMKTASEKLGALYPGWQVKDKRHERS